MTTRLENLENLEMSDVAEMSGNFSAWRLVIGHLECRAGPLLSVSVSAVQW